MEEKFIRKLEKLLTKAGLGEEEIAKIVELAKGETNEEEKPTDEQEGEDCKNCEPKGDETVEEQPKEDVAVVEEAPAPVEDAPVVEEPIAPTDEVVEAPTQEEVVPPLPPVDDGLTQELSTKVDELTKANEGLQERLNALEEALKKSKILTDEADAIGIDQNQAPAKEPIDDPMESVLAEINHRR